ncbi:MAG: 2-oxoacid:acceptor oxidoreductase family protein [Candidatus Eisenbacteria sp.]|nr:2-oxoacid:acceptor oxidoreductase family protein [Candidatus Eisenbacteria bacterium]
MNIYLCGVGGQGIGLLSTVLARACLAAGYPVRGCDTHGLAQRHGSVSSHLRLGGDAFTPLVSPGRAHLVVALERLEALRAAKRMLAPGGTLVYYDTVYQPIHVRMGQATYPTPEDLAAAVATRRAHLERVFCDDLPDSRMQNVALLGRLSGLGIIPNVTPQLFERALDDVVPERARKANRAVYRQVAAG